MSTSSKSSFPSSVCEAAVSSSLLKVEAISECCKLLSPLVSCGVESLLYHRIGTTQALPSFNSFPYKSSVTGSSLAGFTTCFFILFVVKNSQQILIFLNPCIISAAALTTQLFLSILTSPETRFHHLPPITLSFLGLLAFLSAMDPFDLLKILQGDNFVLLHMIFFSIIYVSSQADSHTKESQETAHFNYLNTLINKKSWGLIPQMLLSKLPYKAFPSSTRVMELGLSF